MVSGTRVLVTRSGTDAERTASHLIGRGYQPLLLPLVGVRRMPAISMPEPGIFEAVVVTSANALRLAPPELLRQLAGIACHAVGEQTALVARDLGLAVSLVGSGGGAALGEMIAARHPPPRRVLFLAGRTRSHDLEEALQAAGIAVQVLEVYDTRPLEMTRDHVGAVLEWRHVDATLVYSTLAAAELGRLVRTKAFSFLFENTRHICMSDRIAQALGPMPAGTALVAPERNENAMFAVLERARPAGLS